MDEYNTIKDTEFYQKLTQFPPIGRVILYGSRARGDARERSDIDLAIDCPKASEKDWLTIVEIVNNADTLLKIDCVRYDELSHHNPLKHAIDRDGVLLYMHPSSEPLVLAFSKLKKALDALEAMVKKPMQDDRSNVDACIQRFEFSVELFWQLLKKILESKGQETTYPKDVLQAAYQGKLIDQEDAWLLMLKDRNLTSHTYNEELADQIYQRIQQYHYPVMRGTYETLWQSFGS